mgnify:CR=1 FL=1
MEEIAQTILSARRRRFLRSQPVFERHAPVSEAELFHLATGLNFKFSLGLSKWLRVAGYGDIDGTLSFREEFFSIIHEGALDGCVKFAQDTAGNYYAFNPGTGGIHFVSAANRASAQISRDFPSFLQELIRRDYHLAEWMGSLPASC